MAEFLGCSARAPLGHRGQRGKNTDVISFFFFFFFQNCFASHSFRTGEVRLFFSRERVLSFSEEILKKKKKSAAKTQPTTKKSL